MKTELMKEFKMLQEEIGVGVLLSSLNTARSEVGAHKDVVSFGQNIINSLQVNGDYSSIKNCKDNQMVYECGMNTVYDIICEDD